MDDETPPVASYGEDSRGLVWGYVPTSGVLLQYLGELEDLPEDLVLPATVTDLTTNETVEITTVGKANSNIFGEDRPTLTSLSAEPGIETIERSAFTDVTIGVIDLSSSTVKRILQSAFMRTNSTQVLLPDTILVLGDGAICGKDQLFTEIIVPGNINVLHQRASERPKPEYLYYGKALCEIR